MASAGFLARISRGLEPISNGEILSVNWGRFVKKLEFKSIQKAK